MGKYLIGTLFYFLTFILGIYFFGSGLKTRNYYLILISLLIVYVSLDNFFCSARIKKYGYKAKGHYSFPGLKK